MHIATVELKSTSPYSQSKYLTAAKTEKEAEDDYEKRVWRERLHTTAKGEVCIPALAFKNCLSDAAAYLSEKIPGKGTQTYTKHFDAGILVPEPVMLGIQKMYVQGEWLMLSARGKRGPGPRVPKCYPLIPEWTGTVTFYVLDDTITEDVFRALLRQAGMFIGIGRFRPRNRGYYGRFEIVKMKWSEAV